MSDHAGRSTLTGDNPIPFLSPFPLATNFLLKALQLHFPSKTDQVWYAFELAYCCLRQFAGPWDPRPRKLVLSPKGYK